MLINFPQKFDSNAISRKKAGVYRTTQNKITRRVHIYNPLLFVKGCYFAQFFQFFKKKRRKVLRYDC